MTDESPPRPSRRASTAVTLHRSLGVLPLVFILYFSTSGGPYTTEALVQSVGPGKALAILLFIPLVWSLPEVLIVGELASMLPEEGGYYKWVYRAFGPFWAFQNGWLTWMYSLVDMAIYPVLFNEYLRYFVPGLTPIEQWSVSLAVIWGATALNLRGSRRVGGSSIITGSFIIAAFLALAVVALPHAHHVPWRPFVAPEGRGLSGLAVGLSIALWNYIGWDNASTVQGEVKDASRTYPRALALALPLVMLTYFVPLLATLGATDWSRWRDGAWPDIAIMAAGPVVGRFLAAWIAIGGMVSALSLFNALLLSYSRIPFVLAVDGFLPRTLGKTDRRDTPRNAVLFSALFYSVFVLVPFGKLVIADVLLYSLALGLEFAALVQLRKTEPALRGAFRIPVGRWGVILLAVMPMIILVAMIGISFRDGEYGFPAVVSTIVACVAGVIAYALGDRHRARAAVGVAAD